jgi:hypothetical protein
VKECEQHDCKNPPHQHECGSINRKKGNKARSEEIIDNSEHGKNSKEEERYVD